MSSSAVASYLNLLYLITLPSSAEQLQGIQRLADNEKTLLEKIFKRDQYDYSQPSYSPTQVLPFMFIDHIEQLGQEEQIMTMHCSILFHWLDKRIVWEPKDYGNVNRITRPKSDLPRMWFPAVHFTEMKMRSDQAMQYYNTEVTLMSNGAVYAQVSLTVRSTCSFDFSNYPRDEQSCLLTMFTPLPMSRLKFSRWTALARRSDIFGKDSEGNKLIRSGEFIVTDSIAKPLYILPFGKITTNDTADRPEMMRSIVRFEIKFRRSISYYLLSIAMPTFCIATISYMAATVTNATTSLLWLLMCIAAQIINFTQMVDKLPPDHLHAPLCARMAAVIFVETFALLMFRIVMTYRYVYHVKTSAQTVLMQRIEWGVCVVLAIHCVFNAFILFI